MNTICMCNVSQEKIMISQKNMLIAMHNETFDPIVIFEKDHINVHVVLIFYQDCTFIT